MKSTRLLFHLALLAPLPFMFSSCKEDSEPANPNPGPVVYFVGDVKYNNTAFQQFVCNEFMYDARTDTAGTDTLFFGGERTVDASYMHFQLIRENIFDFSAGDSIVIPFDTASGTEVYCSLLVNSTTPTIFHPGVPDQGMVYIDEIDLSKKYIKGRFKGTFYSPNDSLKVASGQFQIDE